MVAGPYRGPGSRRKGVGLPPTPFPEHAVHVAHGYAIAHDENRRF